MSIIEQLERHVADFESSGGSIPRVRSVGAMFAEYGDQSAQPLHVLTLELQGYIFFGTSNLLLNRIRSRLTGCVRVRPRFVVLDFRRVTGIDSSVSLSLDNLPSTPRRMR